MREHSSFAQILLLSAAIIAVTSGAVGISRYAGALFPSFSTDRVRDVSENEDDEDEKEDETEDDDDRNEDRRTLFPGTGSTSSFAPEQGSATGSFTSSLAGGSTSFSSSQSSQRYSSAPWTIEEAAEREEKIHENEKQEKEERTKEEQSMSSAEDAQTSSGPSARQGSSVPPLGCYDQEGNWTTQRSACNLDQTRRTEAPGQPQTPLIEQSSLLEESNIRRLIEENIISREERDTQRRFLLESVHEATDRLMTLREQRALPPDTNTEVEGTIAWLDQVQQVFSEADPSLEDIQIQAEALKVKFEETQVAVEEALAQSGMDEQRKATDLTDKFDRVLSAIPLIYLLLQEHAIPMPQTATDAFSEATRLYNDIKPLCLAHDGACLRLSDVIPPLERALAFVKQAMRDAGKSELEEKLRTMVK